MLGEDSVCVMAKVGDTELLGVLAVYSRPLKTVYQVKTVSIAPFSMKHSTGGKRKLEWRRVRKYMRFNFFSSPERAIVKYFFADFR